MDMLFVLGLVACFALTFALVFILRRGVRRADYERRAETLEWTALPAPPADLHFFQVQVPTPRADVPPAPTAGHLFRVRAPTPPPEVGVMRAAAPERQTNQLAIVTVTTAPGARCRVCGRLRSQCSGEHE